MSNYSIALNSSLNRLLSNALSQKTVQEIWQKVEIQTRWRSIVIYESMQG